MTEINDKGEVVEKEEDLTQTEAAKELRAAVEGAGDEVAKVEDIAAKPQKEDWQAKKLKERVAKLTAQSKAKDEELARLKATTPPPPEEVLQRQIDEKAEAKAQALAVKMKFDEETLKIVQAGTATFKDFDDKVEKFRAAILDPTDKTSDVKYSTLLWGIIETTEGDPAVSAKIIHSLGSDPEQAERLLGMSQIKMGKELSKMAEAPPVDPVSGAPRPISTIVGGRGTQHVPIDPSDPGRSSKLSSKEWFERRNAQVKANRANGVRMA